MTLPTHRAASSVALRRDTAKLENRPPAKRTLPPRQNNVARRGRRLIGMHLCEGLFKVLPLARSVDLLSRLRFRL